MKPPNSSFGPWPQPAPNLFEGSAPAVLDVPEHLQKEWDELVGRRYLRQIAFDTIPSFLWARRNRGLVPVSDTRLCAILCDGIFSKFLFKRQDDDGNVRFDAEIESLFGTYLADHPDHPVTPGPVADWYVSDFRPMALVPSEPAVDSATSPSVVLYRRGADRRYVLVAIALGDQVFDSHHPAWPTAKFFALQGAGVLTTLLMHPKLHFPSNCVDAITRTRLPDGHWLKKLFLPHFRLAMSVNYAVLYGTQTVLKPGRLYAPYPGTLDEHAEVIATLWRGYPFTEGAARHPTYPRYRLSREPPVIHSDYGTFLERYWKVLFDFAKAVVDAKLAGGADQDVVAWANHCASWLPGFPSSKELTVDDGLARAFASIVLDVSVGHSADHHLYSKVNLQEVPFRLRTEVPTESTTHAPDPGTLTTWKDNFHYRMCMLMFFNPYLIQGLTEVDYGFTEEPLRAAAQACRDALIETDRALRADGIDYVPLDQISCSVQY